MRPLCCILLVAALPAVGQTCTAANALVSTTQTLLAKAFGLDAAARTGAIEEARKHFSAGLFNGTFVVVCGDGSTVTKRVAANLELRRIDKQKGASSGTSGSTNLVASGSVPALLGLATEYGGLTQSFSGTTTTFRTTPAKLIGAMANTYGSEAVNVSDSTLRALERISLAVSFDTSRTATSDTKGPTTLLANYQQLSQASGRFLLWNDRDPLQADNWRQIYGVATSPTALDFANASRAVLGMVTALPGFDPVLDKAMAAFDKAAAGTAAPTETDLSTIVLAYIKGLQGILPLTDPLWSSRVATYVNARLAIDQAYQGLYQRILKKPTLSLDVALTRPPVVRASTNQSAGGTPQEMPNVIAPDHIGATLIYAASLLGSEYTITGMVNFFTEARPHMRGMFRDVQVAAKWDIPVGQVRGFLAKGRLTFSGLYEHLHQKPLGIDLTINDQKINQPGNIGVFQVKYSIPVGDSGVRVPLSFTASNRTELIKEKELRGNVGISFDLDKLFAQR